MSDSASEIAKQHRVTRTKPSCILSTKTKVNTRKFQPVIPISDKYPQFFKLYRHPFGGKTSPYRERAEAWLRSLMNGNEHYPCQQCLASRWICDRKQLRCESCVERHACCPRTSFFKKMVIMQDLGITATEYDQLAKLAPSRQKKPFVTTKSQLDLGKERELEVLDEEGEEEFDQLADDDPVPSSSRTSTSASVFPIRSINMTRLSRASKKPYAVTPGAHKHLHSRMHRAELSTPHSDLKSVTSSAENFNADYGEGLLKELTAIQLALTTAQEKLKALFSNLGIPEELLGATESRKRRIPVVTASTPTYTVDSATSPTRGPNARSKPRTPLKDMTQEVCLSETSIALDEEMDGFKMLTDIHVSEKRKVSALLNTPEKVNNQTRTRTKTPPDELPAITTLNADDNKEIF